MPAQDTEVIDGHAVRIALGGISERTLQRLIADRRFPKPVAISPQTKVWYRRDVEWYLWGQTIKTRLAKRQPDANHTPTTGK